MIAGHSASQHGESSQGRRHACGSSDGARVPAAPGLTPDEPLLHSASQPNQYGEATGNKGLSTEQLPGRQSQWQVCTIGTATPCLQHKQLRQYRCSSEELLVAQAQQQGSRRLRARRQAASAPVSQQEGAERVRRKVAVASHNIQQCARRPSQARPFGCGHEPEEQPAEAGARQSSERCPQCCAAQERGAPSLIHSH